MPTSANGIAEQIGNAILAVLETNLTGAHLISGDARWDLMIQALPQAHEPHLPALVIVAPIPADPSRAAAEIRQAAEARIRAVIQNP